MDRSQFQISCHIQHNDTIQENDDNPYDRNRNMDDYADEEPRGMDEY